MLHIHLSRILATDKDFSIPPPTTIHPRPVSLQFSIHQSLWLFFKFHMTFPRSPALRVTIPVHFWLTLLPYFLRMWLIPCPPFLSCFIPNRALFCLSSYFLIWNFMSIYSREVSLQILVAVNLGKFQSWPISQPGFNCRPVTLKSDHKTTEATKSQSKIEK